MQRSAASGRSRDSITAGTALSPAYAGLLEAAGVVVGATAVDVGVEAIELPGHPFFLATAFQPQVGAGEAGG